jgi:hypothetical protein
MISARPLGLAKVASALLESHFLAATHRQFSVRRFVRQFNRPQKDMPEDRNRRARLGAMAAILSVLVVRPIRILS